MHMITPLPVAGWSQKPGSATLPSFGVQPVILDTEGKEITTPEAAGLLAIKEPWPSALRGVWGDQQRFEETYFPFKNYYLTGDGARRGGLPGSLIQKFSLRVHANGTSFAPASSPALP